LSFDEASRSFICYVLCLIFSWRSLCVALL